MFEKMRKVFGPLAVSVIIGAIALVFVFYGVYNPRTTRGLSSGALAATVNGDAIPLADFQREYQQRVDFYQNMMKGKVDTKLLKQLGLQRQVLEDLVRRKIMTQQAHQLGLIVSDEEVRDKIREMPYFKKDGNFDPVLYQQVLQANRYSPSTFEESMREDLLRNRLVEFMKGRAKISEKEIEDEFKNTEDRRTVEFVVINRDIGRKAIAITDKEITDFLASEAGLSAAKNYYSQHQGEFIKPEETKKGKKAGKDQKASKEKSAAAPKFYAFDEVKKKSATEVLRDRRAEEITKIIKNLGDQALAKAKAGPSELAAFAKANGLEVKTSEKFNRGQGSIMGIGQAPDLITDAFKDDSPLAKGPKLYETKMGGFVVAKNVKTFKPDMANFAKDRDRVAGQLLQHKEQGLFQAWLEAAREKAKIAMNDALLKGGAEEEGE